MRFLEDIIFHMRIHIEEILAFRNYLQRECDALSNISGNFIPFYVDISDLLGEDFNIVSRWEIVHDRVILRNVSSLESQTFIIVISYGEESPFENESEVTNSLLSMSLPVQIIPKCLGFIERREHWGRGV